MCVNIDITQITKSNCEKLLGIKIDSNLYFEDHIESICKKTAAKLNALGYSITYLFRKERCS